MEKREFLGNEVSLLGFGTMRLPLKEAGKPDIDYEAAQRMVDMAIAGGVNYFDTAYRYHEGLSEPFVGQALASYDRASYYLATKMPTWDLVQSPGDVEHIFEEQLENCRVDYFDYYLVHSLNAGQYENMKKNRIYEILREKKEQGIIKHLGFSFHDNPDLFAEIVSSYEWEFAQIQLNYVDWDATGAKRLYETATAANLPVVVMEPVRGGALADLNAEAAEILKQADAASSPASWALRYAASLPNVATVLSGMSSVEQMADNLRTFNDFHPLGDADRETIAAAREALRVAGAVPCTGCNYCYECPVGVDIPRVFSIYNHYLYNKNPIGFKNNYNSLAPEQRASSCIECGNCAALCPQSIAIPERLGEISSVEQDLGI